MLNDQLNDIQSSLHEVEKLIRPSVSKAQSSLTVPVDPQQKLEQLVVRIANKFNISMA